MENLVRFSSCWGVSFEIHPSNANPFAAPAPPPEQDAKWEWLPWNSRRSSLQVAPMSDGIQRSVSRPRSHFCDLADEDGENDGRQQAGEEEEAANDVEKQIVPEQQLRKPSRKESSAAKAVKPQPNQGWRLYYSTKAFSQSISASSLFP